MRNLRVVLISVLIAAPAIYAQAENPAPQANTQSAPSYPESEDGFRAQFKSVALALCSGDAAASARLLEQYRLPDSAAWFAQNFDLSEAAKLTERYDRLFPDYASSMGKTITDVCASDGAQFAIRLMPEPKEPTRIRPKYKRSAVHPLRQLSFARFKFAIQLNGKDEGSWEDTFVYEEGAFHFIGLGGWPFWFWEEGAGPGVFKNGQFTQPPVLISQVPPEYPLAAKVSGLQGVVVLRATIDREGKVRKVDVVRGHPFLIDAAIEAVRKWRYKPGALGGKPIEEITEVSVVFRLH